MCSESECRGKPSLTSTEHGGHERRYGSILCCQWHRRHTSLLLLFLLLSLARTGTLPKARQCLGELVRVLHIGNYANLDGRGGWAVSALRGHPGYHAVWYPLKVKALVSTWMILAGDSVKSMARLVAPILRLPRVQAAVKRWPACITVA